MKKTVIVITTHRGASDETYETAISCQAAMLLKVKGVAIIERARNKAFDLTLDAFRQADAVGVETDMALYLDDDIISNAVDLQRLVDTARAAQHPRSARYVTATGALVGAPYPKNPQRWYFGLGCMAVPRSCLERVASTLPVLGDRLWCQTGAHPTWPGMWIGEDLWWCDHFGGVDLDNFIAVGHLKTMALYPKGPAGGVRVLALGSKV